MVSFSGCAFVAIHTRVKTAELYTCRFAITGRAERIDRAGGETVLPLNSAPIIGAILVTTTIAKNIPKLPIPIK